MSGRRELMFSLREKDPLKQALTFTAEVANSSVTLNKTGSPTVSGLQYRYGRVGRWNDYTPGTTLSLPNIGDEVQFKNTENTLSTSANDYVQFTMTGSIAGSGNVMSMLNWSSECNNACFINLFKDCLSLIEAPLLPASIPTSAYRCYRYMFSGTSIVTAPDLPSTTLAERCYEYMFSSCTSLLYASELPATTLQYYCYDWMYSYCSNLVKAPSTLPADRVITGCYNYMFFTCPKLIQAPVIKATYASGWSCAHMFRLCSKLNYLEVGFTAWPDSTGTTDWVGSVASSGVFLKPDALPEEYGANRIPTNWTVWSGTQAVPLTLTATANNSSVSLNIAKGSPTVSGLRFRRGTSGSWYSYTPGTSIPLDSGESVQFWNTENTLSSNTQNYVQFSMTGTIEASGNIQSMVNWAAELQGTCLYSLFKECTSLTSAAQLLLPAKTAGHRGYNDMFHSCSNLLYPPASIDAVTLGDSACSTMFCYCSALLYPPEIKATTIGGSCFWGMYEQCFNLAYATFPPAQTLTYQCYMLMYFGCKSISSVVVPSVTTIGEESYVRMFHNCTNLTHIEVSFTSWPTGATTRWVEGVAASGVFLKPAELEETYGTANIPANWTVISKVNYLESSGTQYIDTGIIPDNQTYSYLRGQAVGNTPHYGKGVTFGTLETSNRYGFSYGHNGCVLQLVSYYVTTDWAVGADENFDIELVPVDGGLDFKFNNIDTGTTGSITRTGSISPTLTCLLFGNSGDTTLLYSTRIYGFKITKGTTQLNLIPALDSTNTPCMYDRVSNTCLYNAGTGTFLYG